MRHGVPVGFAFGGRTLDLAWKRDGDKNVLTFARTKGPADLRVLFRSAAKEESRMNLNGKPIAPEQEEIRGVMTQRVEISLPPGNSSTVFVEPGQ